MSAALRAELRKLLTTRLWWILLLTMGGYMAFLGAVMAFILTQPQGAQGGLGGFGGETPPPPLDPEAVAATVYTLGPSLGYVFPVVVGALSVTGEFRHMTITPTLLAEPRRTLVLAAKLVASLPVGLLFGIVGTAATLLGGAAVLAAQGEPTALDSPDVQTALWRSVLALAVWAMVGVGFGTALTNQVAAVVTLLAFTQLVEPMMRLLLGIDASTQGIAKWLPGAAGEAVTGASYYASSGLGELLPWWQGLLVLVGYGLALAVLGRLTTLRRDIT